MTQHTLGIIKPDAVSKNLCGAILDRIEKAGFRIVNLRMLSLDREMAGAFYDVHKDKSFFEDLLTFMTSGPIVTYELEGENAVEAYRALMGTTDPADADEGTLRKDFAESKRRNAVHGSDSPENAEKEIKFFFN